MLRSDFNAGKIRALNQVMKLTVAEADKFWPIYRQYEQELAAVGDRKLALIREFLTCHKAGTLADQNSKEMGAQWLQNARTGSTSGRSITSRLATPCRLCAPRNSFRSKTRWQSSLT